MQGIPLSNPESTRQSVQQRARHWRVARLLPAVVLGIGCENPFGGDCIAIGVAAIYLTVVDAVTKAAPDAVLSVRVTDGAFVEERAGLPVSGSGSYTLSLAPERPGVYRVEVKAAGYQDFVQNDVRATRGGDCNYMRPARLTVSLNRAP